MSKQVLDITPSAGITTFQSNEHQRRCSDKTWESQCRKGNYDRTRAGLNFEVAKGGRIQAIDTSVTIPQRIHPSLKERGIVDPNAELKKKGKKPDRRTVVNIIFGGSRDQMHRLAYGDQ